MTPSTLAKLREVHRLIGEIIAAEAPPESDSLTVEEVEFLRVGSPILAIKSVRARLGLGLREAKVFVETEGAKLDLCRWDAARGYYVYGPEGK